jgi:hypothetical protein
MSLPALPEVLNVVNCEYKSWPLQRMKQHVLIDVIIHGLTEYSAISILVQIRIDAAQHTWFHLHTSLKTKGSSKP